MTKIILILILTKFIEMPKELEIVKGSFTDKCVQLYLTALNPKFEYIGKDIKNQKGI